MPRLLACPFCRELFPDGETDGACPECGVTLEPLHHLAPSLEVQAEEVGAREALAPEDRRLPWTHLGRGRGAIVLAALVGLGAFFLPWVEITSPYTSSLSGFALAARGATWLWGGAAAWFVLIPLVLSRRTVREMRGVRVISTVFPLMTAAEAMVLWAIPPQQHAHLTYQYAWTSGLYLSTTASLVAAYFAARFGGPVEDPPTEDVREERVDPDSRRMLH